MQTKILNLGIAFREAYVSAYLTKIDGVDQNIQGADFFFEPILFLAIGADRLKLNAQAGLSYASNASISNYPPFIFSLGLEAKFSLAKPKAE